MNLGQLTQALANAGLDMSHVAVAFGDPSEQAPKPAPYSADAMALDLQKMLEAYMTRAEPKFQRGDLVCNKPNIGPLYLPVAIFVRWLNDDDPNDAAHIECSVRERNTNGVDCVVAVIRKNPRDADFCLSFTAEDSLTLQRYEWQTTIGAEQTGTVTG